MEKNHKGIVIADALYYIQKMRVSAQVRKTHLEKNDERCDLTELLLEKAQDFEDWLNEELRDHVRSNPAFPWFSRVKGIGEVNIGKVISLIDIEKASQVSKLWRYAGYGCDENGHAERMRKGEKLHFNKTLKTMCWRMGKGLIRAKGKYYDFYIDEKRRLTKSLEAKGMTIVPSLELPKEGGKHVEKDGFFALGHVDMMAFRKMVKLFLSHLWTEWRQGAGLLVTEPYVHAIKGHTNYYDPELFVEKA